MAKGAFLEALQALGDGDLTLEADGTYELAFVDSGWTPDPAIGGDEFESDITGGGGTILHRETLAGAAWAAAKLDFDDFTLTDPGGATTAVAIALIKSGNGSSGAGGGGTAGTNRLIAYATSADVTGLPLVFDGTNDNVTLSASGLLQLQNAA